MSIRRLESLNLMRLTGRCRTTELDRSWNFDCCSKKPGSWQAHQRATVHSCKLHATAGEKGQGTAVQTESKGLGLTEHNGQGRGSRGHGCREVNYGDLRLGSNHGQQRSRCERPSDDLLSRDWGGLLLVCGHALPIASFGCENIWESYIGVRFLSEETVGRGRGFGEGVALGNRVMLSDCSLALSSSVNSGGNVLYFSVGCIAG